MIVTARGLVAARSFPIYNRRVVVRPLEQRLRGRTHWRALAERRQLAGLTTRGTVPRRRLEARLILADIDALAAAIGATYEFLPCRAQAKCMELAAQLIAVRKHLV